MSSSWSGRVQWGLKPGELGGVGGDVVVAGAGKLGVVAALEDGCGWEGAAHLSPWPPLILESGNKRQPGDAFRVAQVGV